jgi:carboxypeptidase Q
MTKKRTRMVFRCVLLIMTICCFVGAAVRAQSSPAGATPSITDKLTTPTGSDTGAWTDEQIATMNRIRDAAMSDPYAYNELMYLTDGIGPRLTGSSQATAAVQWVAKEMRAIGADVSLEQTTVPHWVRGQESACLTLWPGMTPNTRQKIVITALGNSVATSSTGLVSPVVVVTSFADLQRLGPEAVRGKIVLFDRPFDKELAAEGKGLDAYILNAPYRLSGASVAASAGAAAVLVRSLGSGDLRIPHTGAVLYTSATKIPAAAITAEDAELIARLAKRGTVVMRLVLTPKTLPPTTSYNVIADWKGSDHPEQVLIVSGHLDSWDLGTGAVDDGAGVVTAMETIQLLHSLGIHPRRTVRLVAWMNEEGGATGAATYASDHSRDFGNHIAAMESDTGCDHPTGLLFSGSPGLPRYLAPVAQVLDALGAGTIDATNNLPSADIAPFVQAGVPGITPAQDLRYYFNYHHTAADTLDKVNPRYLAENAAVIAVTAYALADASNLPPALSGRTRDSGSENILSDTGSSPPAAH